MFPSHDKSLLLIYGVLFIGYGFVVTQKWSRRQTRWWMGVAVFFRLIFLFSTPVLSDDFFRFIWDGRLLVGGFNPYLYLPSEVVNTPIFSTANLSTTLYEGLNSPHYFTVVVILVAGEQHTIAECLQAEGQQEQKGYGFAEHHGSKIGK